MSKTTQTLELLKTLQSCLTNAGEKLGYLSCTESHIETQLRDVVDDLIAGMVAIDSYLYNDVEDEDDDVPDFRELEADEDLDFNKLVEHSSFDDE